MRAEVGAFCQPRTGSAGHGGRWAVREWYGCGCFDAPTGKPAARADVDARAVGLVNLPRLKGVRALVVASLLGDVRAQMG